MTPTRLRDRVVGLVTLAERDLYSLWRQVTTAAQARQALEDVLPALIATYGQAAATVAADWYDEARAKDGVVGVFRAIPAAVPDPGVRPLALWALDTATSLDTALPLVAGGVTKRIANVARATVQGSSVVDPGADGWQRTARPGACGFCRMLEGRGAVYREATVNFGAHDDCKCMAAPAWKGRPAPVAPYRPSTRSISPADRALAREWIAKNL